MCGSEKIKLVEKWWYGAVVPISFFVLFLVYVEATLFCDAWLDKTPLNSEVSTAEIWVGLQICLQCGIGSL